MSQVVNDMDKLLIDEDENDQFSFAMECRIVKEGRTIIAEVMDERRMCDHIMRKNNQFVSETALLNQACESYLSELQAITKTMVESLSNNGLPLSKLHSQCKAAEHRLAQLDEDIQEKNRLIDAVVKERDYLLSTKEELTNYSDMELRAVVDFYRATTRIRWDFDTDPHKVVGLIAEPDNTATFDFDTNQNSMFFITNKIWNLMLSPRCP